MDICLDILPAINGGEDVKANLKDFPKSALEPYNLEVQHPDDFVMNQLELRPFETLEVIGQMHEAMRKPLGTAAQLIDIIEKSQLPQTAQYLRMRVGLI